MSKKENLKPFTSNQSRDEAVKNGRKGGKKSGEVRREKKLLKQIAEEKLQELMPSGKTFQECAVNQLSSIVLSGLIKPSVIVKVLEFLRDTAGQKPIDKAEIVNNECVSATVYITKEDCYNPEKLIKLFSNQGQPVKVRFVTQEEIEEVNKQIDLVISGG